MSDPDRRVGPVEEPARLRHAYARMLAGVDHVSRWLLVAIMAVLVVLVVVQVFYRYALASSIVFAYEISRLLFVWAMFLAIPHGVRMGVHVGIDLLVRRMPVPLGRFVDRLTAGIGAVLMFAVAILGVQVAYASWDQLLPTVELSAALFHVAVVLGAAHAALHLLAKAWYGGAS